MSDDERTYKWIAFIGGLVLMVPLAIWSGWVGLQLYNWFVVSIPGAPRLTLAHMVGIKLFVGFLTYQFPKYDPETPKPLDTFCWSLAMGILFPLLTLFSGFVYNAFLNR